MNKKHLESTIKSVRIESKMLQVKHITTSLQTNKLHNRVFKKEHKIEIVYYKPTQTSPPISTIP